MQGTVSTSAQVHETSSGPTLTLKQNGIITDEASDMVCGLVANNNIPVSQVQGVIDAILSALDAKVDGSLLEKNMP